SLAVERLTATGPHRRSDSNPVPRNMRAGISLSEAFCGPRGLYRLMASLSALLDNVVDGAETVMLFAPNSSYYERSLDIEDVSVVVCAAENSVGAERFVELPLEFTDVAERIRFGIEGAIDEEFLAEGDEVVCATKVFDDAIDTVTRIRVGEFDPSGTYDLLTDSRADPEVISAVIDVAIELGQKGQKG